MMTDIATITALLMIALFFALDGLGRAREERDSATSYFASFAASLAGYVFFDNTLSLVLFNPAVAAKINTVGVTACSLLLLASYSLFVARIIDLPDGGKRLLFRCCVPAIAVFPVIFTVIPFGWEWYMRHFDPLMIAVYAFSFLYPTATLAKTIAAKRMWRDRFILPTAASMIVILLSLLFYRVLITVNTANFLMNNSVILGGMAFTFPLFLARRNSAEFRELSRLRLERETARRRRDDGLRDIFASDGSIAKKPNARETEVCEALLGGQEYKEIADALGLSLSGVKKRAHALYDKLGVQNRTELFNRVARLRDRLSADGVQETAKSEVAQPKIEANATTKAK